MSPKTTEADIEDYLVKEIKALGGEVRKVNWLGRRHAPDRLVMLNGPHFVELKAPGEKPRDGQTREHLKMRKHGLNVWILDTYYKVDMFVEEIKK